MNTVTEKYIVLLSVSRNKRKARKIIYTSDLKEAKFEAWDEALKPLGKSSHVCTIDETGKLHNIYDYDFAFPDLQPHEYDLGNLSDYMKKFEIGETYTMRSICDYNCIWSYTVIGRTASTVTLKSDTGETIQRRIIRKLSEMRNAESVYPLGKYSMCPILSADNI